MTNIASLWSRLSSPFRNRWTDSSTPPEPQSRCYAYVPLEGGLTGIQPRAMHWFGGRGKPASLTCLHCGFPNPRMKSAPSAVEQAAEVVEQMEAQP